MGALTSSASKRTLGPKLSKSRKGKGRPPTRASRSTPATACKPEAEMEASSCGETDYLHSFYYKLCNCTNVMTIRQSLDTEIIYSLSLFFRRGNRGFERKRWQVSDIQLIKWAAKKILYLCLIYQCDFYCGQYDSDVHVSVADPDGALDEDPPFRDDPNDLIYKPKTKMYSELTVFPKWVLVTNVTLYEDFQHDER